MTTITCDDPKIFGLVSEERMVQAELAKCLGEVNSETLRQHMRALLRRITGVEYGVWSKGCEIIAQPIKGWGSRADFYYLRDGDMWIQFEGNGRRTYRTTKGLREYDANNVHVSINGQPLKEVSFADLAPAQTYHYSPSLGKWFAKEYKYEAPEHRDTWPRKQTRAEWKRDTFAERYSLKPSDFLAAAQRMSLVDEWINSQCAAALYAPMPIVSCDAFKDDQVFEFKLTNPWRLVCAPPPPNARLYTPDEFKKAAMPMTTEDNALTFVEALDQLQKYRTQCKTLSALNNRADERIAAAEKGEKELADLKEAKAKGEKELADLKEAKAKAEQELATLRTKHNSFWGKVKSVAQTGEFYYNTRYLLEQALDVAR